MLTRRLIRLEPHEVMTSGGAEWQDSLFVVKDGSVRLQTMGGESVDFSTGAIFVLSLFSISQVTNVRATSATLLVLQKRDHDFGSEHE